MIRSGIRRLVKLSSTIQRRGLIRIAPISSPSSSSALSTLASSSNFHHHLGCRRELSSVSSSSFPTATDVDDSFESRVKAHKEARHAEAHKARRAVTIADALRLIRSNGKEDHPTLSHQQALLTLGHCAANLAPEDALLVIRQSLEKGLGKVAMTTLSELRKRNMNVVLDHADDLVQQACAAGKYRMAIMVMEDVQDHPGCKIPSREAYLALIHLLSERNRFKDYWSFAEGLMSTPGVKGVITTDIEVMGAVMIICWKARKWISIQRLLLDNLVADGVLPTAAIISSEGGATGSTRRASKSEKTVYALEALVEQLRQKQVITDERKANVLQVEHCNMLLRAYVGAKRVNDAVAFVHAMSHDNDDDERSRGLPSPDAHSLALVMDALGKEGRWEECLSFVERFKEEMIARSQAQRRRRSRRESKTVATEASMVYKTAIAALGKMGMWEGALTLFYEMHERGIKIDPQVYTTLFKALKTGGRWDTALSFLDIMKQENVTPSRMTYNVILSSLGVAGEIEKALELFQEMKDNGVAPTPLEYGTLISACGRLGKMEEAMVLFQEAQRQQQLEEEEEEGVEGEEGGEVEYEGSDGERRYLNIYTQMLKAYGKAGRWQETVDLIHEMRGTRGIEPTFSHYYEAMKACAKAGQCEKCLALLQEIADRHIRVHILCWNAAFDACKLAGRGEEALKLLERMKLSHIEPGHINYARAMAAFGNSGSPEKAFEILEDVYAKGRKPDRATYGTLIQICGQAGMWQKALDLLQEMSVRGIGPPDGLNHVHAVHALITCNRIDEAITLVKEAAPSNPLAFHLVMLALVDKGDAATTCQELLKCMVERHAMIPDGVTEALMEYAVGGKEGEGRKRISALTGSPPPRQDEGMEMMTLDEVKAKLQEDILINPHDELKRMRIASLGHTRLR